MAALPGNPARTNSRAIFTSMTQIASWSWPNAFHPSLTKVRFSERRRPTSDRLGFDHIKLGRYAFTLPETVARGELRPLRDPMTARDDEG
jgi:hypothetical protein